MVKRKLRLIPDTAGSENSMYDMLSDNSGKDNVLSLLCDILPDILVLVDPAGGILDLHAPSNENALNLPPYKEGMQLSDIFPERVEFDFLFAIQKIKQTGSVSDLRFSCEFQGKERFFDCRLLYIESRDAYLGMIRDITECSDDKSESDKSEARYRTLLDNAPFPIFISRLSDGVFVYDNKRAQYEFGHHGKSVAGQKAMNFYVNPEDRTRVFSAIKKKGEITDYELQLFDYNMNPYWALMSGIRVEFLGEPALMVSINNINEHKIAEMNLLKEHEMISSRYAGQNISPLIYSMSDDSSRPTNELIQASINAAALSFSDRDPLHIHVEFDSETFDSSFPGEGSTYESDPPRSFSRSALTTFGKTISLSCTFYRFNVETLPKVTAEEEKLLVESVLTRLTYIINRRHSDELLHEQDDFLRLMLSQTTYGIVLIDPETLKFKSSNETAYKSLGYTQEEFSELCVCDIEKDCTPEHVHEVFARVSSGEIIQRESIHKDKFGDEHEVFVHVYPLRLKGKSYFCLYFRDISDEKRRAVEQKQKTDKILLFARLIRKISVLPSGTDGEVAQYIREVTEILGKETGITQVSIWIRENNADSLTCLSSFNAVTQTIEHGMQMDKSLFHQTSFFIQSERYFQSDDIADDPRMPENVKAFFKQFNISAVLTTSIFFRGHFQGALVFGYENCTHYWDSSEISLCCEVADQLGMAYLNHERIEVTRALQHSEYFLKRAQAVSKTGHWFYDIAGDILSCSDETWRIFGLPAGKVRSLSSFLKRSHPEDVHIIRDAFRAAKNGTPFQLTQRIVVSGETRWIEMRAEIEFDNENRPITFLGTVQDISEKIEASNELDCYRQHLEELVKIRTAELEEATEAAKNANKAKSTFLSNMSHEIRTPINAIVGFAYLLRRDPLTPRQLDELNKLSAASEHLLQIINDILDLSKIEAGKITLETIDFEPARVVDKILNIVQEDAVRKNLPITVSMHGIPPVLRGDGNRVAQILMNLLTNAVKFTESGGIMLTGRVINEDEEKVTVVFRVQDTGIGIKKDHMSKLFDEFEQATNETTRKYGGTGLGLPITKRLAELMGGEIRVESSPGKGSSFEVVIPFRKSEHIAIQPAELFRLDGARALLIDDSLDECEILTTLLADYNVRAEHEVTAGRGLKRLLTADSGDDPFRLVFVDYRMPGMDGLELLKALSVSDVQKMPIVIMVTAHAFALKDDPRKNGLSFTLLNKPVTPSRLKDVLTMALADQLTTRRSEEIENIKRELPSYAQAKILLVEDNAINREVAEGLLSSVGLPVETAENGLVAVERAKKKRYDLILMDLQMPEMDGFDATKQIRLLPQYKDTPIIAMTAVAFQEDRTRCLEVGMTDHLSKPVDPETLFSVMAKWLPVTQKKSRQPSRQKIEKSGVVLPGNTTEIESSLRTIKGLDPAFGLKNLQGNLPWYVKLIDQFTTRHRTDAQDMIYFLEKKDLASISKVAHSLKGTSSTLGFVEVQAQAREIEVLIADKKPESEILDKIQLLGKTLETASEEIRRIISSIRTFSPDYVVVGFDINKVREIVDRMIPLIKSHDMEANNLFDENRELMSRAFGFRINALEHHLQNFDYKDAHTLLLELVERMEAAEKK